MPGRGRNITVYLMDGEATGKIKVSIFSWNGVAYKIPRNLLSECRDFEAFSRSGVYFLFGEHRFYVGQAEVRQNGGALYSRVSEHTTDRYKDFWDEVVIFTSKDGTLGRTDVTFLENLFYEKGVTARRYTVLNGNRPSSGTVTEEKRSELEDYAEYAELILGVLGYKVFEPVEGQPQGHLPAVPETPANPPVTPGVQQNLPALPSEQLKIGEFVYTAMRQLGESGFQFSDEAIEAMSTPEWSSEHFHTKKPFMKKYIPGLTDNKGADGFVRFKSDPFTFGSTQVLISKEWYERQRQLFIAWYRSLGAL